ncbi:MAG: phosphomannomutase/phosphoglucomutase [Candidatus Babeliales bacterium]|nr:phosphomannomutase/phosphoglucomutase [Candidatus Babeliales bacterium]
MIQTIINSQNNFFKEYDLRGNVGKDFEIKNVYNIARAIATFFIQKSPTIKNIAIGMDGRIHSPAMKEEICRAFIDSGLNVTFLGLCTTPVMYYATHTLNVDAGIMITASHNPKEDNGLKLILNRESVWGNQIRTIRDIYNTGLFVAANKGTYTENLLCTDYVNYLCDKFAHLVNADINCIIDCSNGAGGSVMPMLVAKMGWTNVVLMNEIVDGNFPNHEPDPTQEKNLKGMQEYLAANPQLAFGMALDGDADRLSLMTKDGKLLAGDQLLGIFSQSITKTPEQNAVIVDIMCSNGIVDQFKKLGFTPHFARTGIAFIKQAMHQHNALLGGELSGHICFNDRYLGYDDGVYSIMRMMEMMHNSDKSLEEMLQAFSQKNIVVLINMPCSSDKKFFIIEEAKKLFMQQSDINIIDIDGVRVNTNFGCGILRASNTEPLIRLRIEAGNQENLLELKNTFFNVLQSHFDNEWLKAQLSL